MKTKFMRNTIFISLLVSMYSHNTYAYQEHLNVNKYYQDDPCWCSIAAIEMWTDWLNGVFHSTKDQQEAIATRYGVGSYESPYDNTQGWACVLNNRETGGLTMGEVEKAMEKETGRWFSQYKRFSANSFAKKIVKEIHSKEPVIVMGNTIKNNGEVRERGHYYLVDGFSLSRSKYSSRPKYITGFYVNDPASGAPGLGHIKSINPKTLVSKNNFFKERAAKWRGRYYLVRD